MLHGYCSCLLRTEVLKIWSYILNAHIYIYKSNFDAIHIFELGNWGTVVIAIGLKYFLLHLSQETMNLYSLTSMLTGADSATSWHQRGMRQLTKLGIYSLMKGEWWLERWTVILSVSMPRHPLLSFLIVKGGSFSSSKVLAYLVRVSNCKLHISLLNVVLKYMKMTHWDCFKSFMRHLLLSASIASRFHITKYPTLKLLRNGQATKREYRGQRSADAFASYIKEQLRDPIKILQSLDEINELEVRCAAWVFYLKINVRPSVNMSCQNKRNCGNLFVLCQTSCYTVQWNTCPWNKCTVCS